MIKFNPKIQKNLTNIFKTLNQNNITYVVLRSYEDLPFSTQGNDLDVLIKNKLKEIPELLANGDISFPTKEQFGNAISKKNTLQNYIKGILNPKKVSNLIVKNPQIIKTKILNLLRQKPSSADGQHLIKKTVLNCEDLQIDFINHLYYKSPMNGKKIRVNPIVEKMMFTERQKKDGFFIPAAPDALAHLLGRIIFDFPHKGEEPPARHLQKCGVLFDEISKHNQKNKRFKFILKNMFFNADELVYNLCAEKKYKIIRSELYKFSDY